MKFKEVNVETAMLHCINIDKEDFCKKYNHSIKTYLQNQEDDAPVICDLLMLINDLSKNSMWKGDLPQDVMELITDNLEVVDISVFENQNDYEKNHKIWETIDEDIFDEDFFPMAIIYFTKEAFYQVQAAFNFFSAYAEWAKEKETDYRF